MTFRRLLSPALALAAVLPAAGCEKIVRVRLNIAEPCGQENQALNGVKTFRLSSNSSEDEVAFTKDEGGRPLALGLGDDVVVTLEGFTEGDTGAIGTASPVAVGRSLPLVIDDDTQNLDLTFLMGKVDTFGGVGPAQGDACPSLTASTAGPKGRHGHTATFVPGINKVLVAGGAVWVDDGSGQKVERLIDTVELYDPASGTFEAIGKLPQTRAYHTATALPDGRVVIAGGFSEINGVAQAIVPGLIIYDPKRPKEDPYTKDTALLESARAHHTALYLQQPNVIVFVGGCQGEGCRFSGATMGGGRRSTDLTPNVEVLDVASLSTIPATTGLQRGRAMHAVSAISPKGFLVSGGVDPDGPVCSIELFEVEGTSVQRLNVTSLDLDFDAGDCPLRHAQVTLDETRVAFIGGQVAAPGGLAVNDDGSPSAPGTATVRFFNSVTGIEAPAIGTSLPQLLGGGRTGHQAALLEDGSVLVVGGHVQQAAVTAERLVPDGNNGFTAQAIAGPLGATRDRAVLTFLPNNQALLTGGYLLSQPPETVDDAELYFGE